MASFSGNGQAPLNAIVADIGQYATKVGWAGDDQPKSYFRSNVAVLREDSGDDTSSSTPKNKTPGRSPIVDVRYDYLNRPIKGYNNSDSSASLDGSWEISNPVDPATGLWYQPTNGTSMQESSIPADSDGADWAELIPQFLRHGYRTGLNVHSDSWDYPLLLCERSYNPPPLRQKALEVLMEEMQLSAVFFARDAVMQCYAVGRTQGTVVDIGFGGTTVSPVFEGYVEQHGIQRAPIGLNHVDFRIMEQMDQLYAKENQGSTFMPLYQVKQQRDFGWKTPKRRTAMFHEAARLFVAQECRLAGAGIAVDTTTTSNTGTTGAPTSFQAPNKSFSLPDGTEIHLASQFRFHSANILFGKPQIVAAGNPVSEGGVPATAVAPTTMSSEQEARHVLFQKAKNDLVSYIQYQQQMQDENEKAGVANENDDFSEAAAVGIAKRRTKRQKKDSVTPARVGKATKKASFQNSRLNASCSKYFQAFLDESLTSAPVAQMICEAAYKCEREQQPALLGNIILGGGGSCVGPTEQAAPDLIKEQTESLIHTHTPGWKVKVMAPGFGERSVLPWLGGSILASLGSFHEMYVTKADYDEWGPAIVNRKCP